MSKPTNQTEEAMITADRDRMLRRLIALFVVAAFATFGAAVGVSAWHGPSHRLELAQQQAPLTPAAP